MSGIYVVSFEQVAVTAVQDLLAVSSASGKQCVLLALHLSQTNRGTDAQEEVLGLRVRSGQTVSGTGGSAPTPTPNDPVGASASSFTARANDATTIANTGTIVRHYTWNWNIRGPFDIILPEGMQILFGNTRKLTFELFEAPSVSMTMSGSVVVQEIG